MTGNRFVMRRDTRKHMPPHTLPHSHPVMPRRQAPRRDHGAAPEFWRDEEPRPPRHAAGEAAEAEPGAAGAG